MGMPRPSRTRTLSDPGDRFRDWSGSTLSRIAKLNTPRTTTSPSTPAPPAIENRSIKLDIISGQSFYRRARASDRLPHNKMLINVALGRTGGTGNGEQGTGNKEQGSTRNLPLPPP